MKPGISRTGRPVAVGHAAAAPDRAAEQRGGFHTGQALAPEWGEVRKRDAHVHFVPDIGVTTTTAERGVPSPTMRAATIVDGRIEVADHPDPEPQDGQLLVRVRAAGLNGADMMQLAGKYPAPPGAPEDIPGLELAGEVVSCGRRAGRFEPGDRVMAIVAGGGQAEYAVVHERTAMPVPEELDWTAAGGVPEVFTTAHDALFTQAGLMCGERLLVARRRGRRRHGRGAARGDGRRARDRDRPQRARPRADRRARRARDRARGLRRGGRVRRHPRARRRAQPVREPRLARDRRARSASSASARGRRPRSTCAS